jgi:hypothetical protein
MDKEFTEALNWLINADPDGDFEHRYPNMWLVRTSAGKTIGFGPTVIDAVKNAYKRRPKRILTIDYPPKDFVLIAPRIEPWDDGLLARKERNYPSLREHLRASKHSRRKAWRNLR